MKRFLILALIFSFAFTTFVFSQEAEEMSVTGQETEAMSITGKVEQIAEDGSYIVVDSKTIITTQEFLDESYLEAGDMVKLTLKNTDKGLEIVDYEYVYEEEPESVE